MAKVISDFEQFKSDLSKSGMAIAGVECLSMTEKIALGGFYGNIKTFLQGQQLVTAGDISKLDNMSARLESFNSAQSIVDVGGGPIADLCKNCKVTEKYMLPAIESVALCLENYRSGYNAGKHFEEAPANFGDTRGFVKMYSPVVGSAMVMSPNASYESFGSYTDSNVMDAKVAIAVTLMRFHRGGLHRIVPLSPTDSNVVMFDVEHLEVYDLTKSANLSAATRYEDTHRVPMVELYKDPTSANNTAKSIVPLAANDGGNLHLLNVAGALTDYKVSVEHNLFDLSLDANVVGYQAVDYTDLVSEGAKLKDLIFKIVKTNGVNPDTVEYIRGSVLGVGGSRFTMGSNSPDSADRYANVKSFLVFNNATENTAGASSVFAGLSGANAIVQTNFTVAGQVNLKSSNTMVQAVVTNATLKNIDSTVPVQADTDLMATITITAVGYAIDAHYSEENVRKTTKALRIMSKPVSYEIPGTASVVVQFSQTQPRPESVIDGLSKLLAIGNDDRGIQVILDIMGETYTRLQAETSLINAGGNYTSRVMNEFVAGHKSKPAIAMGTIQIDADAFKNMRSAEIWGDIRGFMEKALMEYLVRLMNESLYMQALNPGEEVTFNVLTSPMIMACLLSVPHYHNLLADKAADQSNDGIVEFRRVLPNGMVLNVVTTNFDYMADRMLIIPNRPTTPTSELNFAINFERGTYVAQATPTSGGAIFNQLVANSREFPITTNCMGAIISIQGLSAIFDGMGVLGDMV